MFEVVTLRGSISLPTAGAALTSIHAILPTSSLFPATIHSFNRRIQRRKIFLTFLDFLLNQGQGFLMSKSRRLLFIAGGTTLSFSLTTYYLSRHSSSQSPSLNLSTFTPWTIVSKIPVTSNSSILTLSHPGTRINEELWRQGTWSVEVKNPLLMVARSYTPLPPPCTGQSGSLFRSGSRLSSARSHTPSSDTAAPSTDGITSPQSTPPDPEGSTMRLLVRKQGETSSHLLSLPLSSEVHIRGPHVSLPLPDQGGDILFLAGGTGIAPALQLAYRAYISASPARISVLYCVRDTADCAGGKGDAALMPRGWFGRPTREFGGEENEVVRMLHGYRTALSGRGGGMEVGFFPDRERRPAVGVKELKVALERHRSLAETQRQRLDASDGKEGGRRLLVVSGPPGFVECYAGPKVWGDGREMQGPLGGVLGGLKRDGLLEGWDVYKL